MTPFLWGEVVKGNMPSGRGIGGKSTEKEFKKGIRERARGNSTQTDESILPLLPSDAREIARHGRVNDLAVDAETPPQDLPSPKRIGHGDVFPPVAVVCPGQKLSPTQIQRAQQRRPVQEAARSLLIAVKVPPQTIVKGKIRDVLNPRAAEIHDIVR